MGSASNFGANVDLGPSPRGAAKRSLLARGHGLKASLFVGRQGVTDAFVGAVREAFAGSDLLKVRIDADDADQTEAAGEVLADRVPCHFLQRVGRVILLYRPLPGRSPSPRRASE